MSMTAPRCLTISPQVLLAHYDLAGQQHATVKFDEGVSLRVAYFNHFSGLQERTMPMHLCFPITLSFAKDEQHPGWCYVQQWNAKDGRYYCTCYLFRRSDNVMCSHTQALAELDSLIA